jgi:hypothetical protein
MIRSRPEVPEHPAKQAECLRSCYGTVDTSATFRFSHILYPRQPRG